MSLLSCVVASTGDCSSESLVQYLKQLEKNLVFGQLNVEIMRI